MNRAIVSSNAKGGDPVPKFSQPAEESAARYRPDASFLTIQRAVGNRALCKLLESTAGSAVTVTDQWARAQEPLRRGEAARSSAGVMLQRKCACGGSIGPTGECEQCRKKRLQRKAINGSTSKSVPPIVHEVLGSPGQRLDASTRAFFEPRFGRDLGHVRVHTDRQAEQSAHALDAWAYTVGRNVVFAGGKYAPLTKDGRYLLAHELIHVMQQTGGQPSSIGVTEPSSPAEREAGANARKLTDERSAQFRATVTTGTMIARYRPPPPIVRTPPRAPTGMTRPSGVVPRSGPTQAPGAQPGPSSFDEGYEQLKAEGGWMARALRELEWPVATLDRGGSPPHFITVLSERFGPYTDQTGGTFRVKYRPHKFHILDAIGYAVANAKTTAELNDVRERYIDAPKMLYGFTVPADLDPGGKERLRVYVDALNRLVQSASQPKPAQPAPQPQPGPQPQPTPPPAVPTPKATGSVKGRSSNATCTSKARKLSATGCNFVAVDPTAIGGLAAYNEVRTPQASQYCRGFTGGEPCEYWLYPPGGGPDGPREWARFDGYDGYSLIECKCGYDGIVDAAEGVRGLGFEQRKALDILDNMLREVRKHRDLARECGVPYRMVVSSAKLKAYLMSYGGIPGSLIDLQPSEKCEEGAL